jgi:HEAT repeat protein
MDYSLTFARHFARLVWLLLNEGHAFDAQIATLRSLVNVSRDGEVKITTNDWKLMANGQALPDRFTGTQDLVAQLIGHSVLALSISQGASPADLLLAARVLASEAAPGDGGRNVISRLAALDAHTLRVDIDPAAFAEEPKTAAPTPASTKAATPAHAPPPMRSRTPTMNMVVQHDDDITVFSNEEDLYGAASLTGTHNIDSLGLAPLSILTPNTTPGLPLVEGALAPTPPGGISSIPAIPAVIDTGPPLDPLDSLMPPEPIAPFPELKLDEPEIMRGADPEQVLQANTAVTPKGTMVKMFEALDAANTSANAAKQLELLVKLATESARKERVDMVADIFYGIVKREDAVEEKSIKRQFSMSIRRLSTPSVLQCLVELLPRRRENYDQYMAVFEKSDEAGVEALVEALVAAPSIQDRRVFYDALLRLRSGIRTLMFMLGDPRWYVVRNAAELLGEMKSMEAEPELTKLLQHRDDRVRTAAAAALAKLGGTAAVRGMRASLAGEAVRERVSEAMSPREGSSVDSLIRAVDREEDSRVQMAMLAALGQLGTPAAVDKLLEIARSDRKLLARSRPTPMRVAAVHALGDVKSNTAHSALQALLHDKEKAVRGAASWVIMGRRRENGQWPEENGSSTADDVE